jgi:polar amino acid transport system permease protein
MNWSWLANPEYIHLLGVGLFYTLVLLFGSVFFGFILAVPIGLVQVVGPAYLRIPAKIFCSFIRGTPLLIQMWLLYYGLGSIFPSIPWLRSSFMWPILREGFYYAMLSLSLSVAGYEGEIMRGAFLGVPRGELEAARAFGMSGWKVLSRVWFPRAALQVLPTLAGEMISQLKSTPLAFTVTVMDLMGARFKISSDTYIIYEPLILIAVLYMLLTFVITRGFNYLERLIPQRR